MLLELDSVTTGYGKAQVLKDICLHVYQGEIVAYSGRMEQAKALHSVVSQV